MQAFAKLVDNLYFLNSNNAKAALLLEYLKNTPDPDRGWAISAIAGTLNLEFFKRRTIKDLITERVDPVLFDLSYDYVGEMSETVAHLWSSTVTHIKEGTDNYSEEQELPSLAEVINKFSSLKRNEIKPYLASLLDIMTPSQRWALLKLGTRGLRIGMSARFLKKVLASYGAEYNPNINIEDIERVWHGVTPPYCDLFAWLEAKAEMPDITNKLTFQPVMLSHPIAENDLSDLNIQEWQIEWKFDGIRAQLLSNQSGIALYSRTGDDISASFPDLISQIQKTEISGRFDGELVALETESNNKLSTSIVENDYANIGSFNSLQQRLNKKKPSKALMQKIPAGLILYDVLQVNNQDLRETPLKQRIKLLHQYLEKHKSQQAALPLFHSQTLTCSDIEALKSLKVKASELSNGYIEGLMLKKKSSLYVAGRPKGKWYKLKREPKLIDAVIMYAQRGHGKRSSFYSDYTFGCWQDGQLLPIGKAYSGFTDEELKKLDNWVRRHSIGRFGPVKEVKKELVFEVAFDSVAPSNRHKSKVALRFPRIHRIRWDKPANEADHLDTLIAMIES